MCWDWTENLEGETRNHKKWSTMTGMRDWRIRKRHIERNGNNWAKIFFPQGDCGVGVRIANRSGRRRYIGMMKHFQSYKGKDGTENTRISGKSSKFVLTKKISSLKSRVGFNMQNFLLSATVYEPLICCYLLLWMSWEMIIYWGYKVFCWLSKGQWVELNHPFLMPAIFVFPFSFSFVAFLILWSYM